MGMYTASYMNLYNMYTLTYEDECLTTWVNNTNFMVCLLLHRRFHAQSESCWACVKISGGMIRSHFPASDAYRGCLWNPERLVTDLIRGLIARDKKLSDHHMLIVPRHLSPLSDSSMQITLSDMMEWDGFPATSNNLTFLPEFDLAFSWQHLLSSIFQFFYRKLENQPEFHAWCTLHDGCTMYTPHASIYM